MVEANDDAPDPMAAMRRSAEEAARGLQEAMGMDPAHMSETLRAMTERSVEQSRAAYARLKSAAEEATRTLGSTVEDIHQSSLQLSKSAVDAMRQNADLGFSHLEKLMTAKSFSEVVELQASYVRRQIEVSTEQAKEMQTLAQAVAQDLLKPGRDAFQHAADPAQAG